MLFSHVGWKLTILLSNEILIGTFDLSDIKTENCDNIKDVPLSSLYYNQLLKVCLIGIIKGISKGTQRLKGENDFYASFLKMDHIKIHFNNFLFIIRL